MSTDDPTSDLSHDAPPLPLLVTGIAGVPGYNAFHYFRSLYGDQVIGIRQKSMWPLSGEGILPCDIEDAHAVRELWQKYRFASVLNAAGSCRLKSCELDPEMAHRVNVTGTENIATMARQFGALVIHLSIDLVFAGRPEGNYREDETPDPVTVYGAKMAFAESVIHRACPDACVLRISLPMGVSFNGHAGAIDWIASRFQQRKKATLYFDEVRTPTYSDCMNRLFHHLFARPLCGTFHAGGNRRLSLYEIAQIVNRVGGYSPELLMGCMRAEAGPMPPRAGNVTLNSNKLAEALGFAPFVSWPLEESLLPTDDQWHFRRDEAAGSTEAVEQRLYQIPHSTAAIPPNRNELWGSRFGKSS